MENKANKITIRLTDEMLKKCEEGMAISGCGIRNDFVERAIEFYTGYLSTQTHTDFLADALVESIAGTVKT